MIKYQIINGIDSCVLSLMTLQKYTFFDDYCDDSKKKSNSTDSQPKCNNSCKSGKGNAMPICRSHFFDFGLLVRFVHTHNVVDGPIKEVRAIRSDRPLFFYKQKGDGSFEPSFLFFSRFIAGVCFP